MLYQVDMGELEEGGTLDEDTMPEWIKNMRGVALQNSRNMMNTPTLPTQASVAANVPPPTSFSEILPPPGLPPGLSVPQPPEIALPPGLPPPQMDHGQMGGPPPHIFPPQHGTPGLLGPPPGLLPPPGKCLYNILLFFFFNISTCPTKLMIHELNVT